MHSAAETGVPPTAPPAVVRRTPRPVGSVLRPSLVSISCTTYSKRRHQESPARPRYAPRTLPGLGAPAGALLRSARQHRAGFFWFDVNAGDTFNILLQSSWLLFLSAA